MQDISGFWVTDASVSKGKLTDLRHSVPKTNKTEFWVFKMMRLVEGCTTEQDPRLQFFLESLRKRSKLYKRRNFADKKGDKQDFILDFVDGGDGVGFFLKRGDESVKKMIRRVKQKMFSERDTLLLLSQFMMGYKLYYDNCMIYGVLNPGNLIRFNQDYVLTPPSTLIKDIDIIHPDSNTNDYDFLYTAPEVLEKAYMEYFRPGEHENQFDHEEPFFQDDYGVYQVTDEFRTQFEEKDHKQDIWSLGVIMYQMLYGVLPFEFTDQGVMLDKDVSFLEQKWKPKKKLEETIFRWYWYHRSIALNPLRFPNNNSIQMDIVDLLSRMLEKDPNKRIGFQELNKHKFMEYLVMMMRTKQFGVAYRRNQIRFKDSVILEENLTRKRFKGHKKEVQNLIINKVKQRKEALKAKNKAARLEKKKQKLEREKKRKEEKKQAETERKEAEKKRKDEVERQKKLKKIQENERRQREKWLMEKKMKEQAQARSMQPTRGPALGQKKQDKTLGQTVFQPKKMPISKPIFSKILLYYRRFKDLSNDYMI